ncbi:TPA: hypothetical protein R1703_001022 [Campylobacter lari]|nr:hypothetical protein [Campylobacter sp. CNRCH_2015_0338h]MCR8704762.1 hypothetical protein [Campylobacter sp. 2352 PW]HEC1727914.1 hypothetical protein [Campylobacter lari]MCV3471852.1 hypothetical protein [Campylobacter sp. CNRCH_2015_0338h]HEC1763744.1 hypothetical protein [Campylobacter lari]HEC1774937.1 hypothetical protein [Campylobacter lari]
MIDYIIIALFIAFTVFLVFGFNRQMQEKAKQREEKLKTKKDFKKNR